MKKCSISKVDEYLPSWNSGSSSYIKQKDECQLVASSENKTKQNTNSRYYCLIVSNSILFRLHHCTWILANLQSDRIPKYFGYGTHAQSFGLCPSSGLGVTLMENTWNLNSQVQSLNRTPFLNMSFYCQHSESFPSLICQEFREDNLSWHILLQDETVQGSWEKT